MATNSNNSTSGDVVIGLDVGAYDPVWCSLCRQKFANYHLFADVRHACSACNWAMPLNKRPAWAAVDPVDGTSNVGPRADRDPLLIGGREELSR